MDHVEGVSASNQQEIDTGTPEDILAKAKSLPKWRVSDPMGGRMSDIDSIFTADEKYTISHILFAWKPLLTDFFAADIS